MTVGETRHIVNELIPTCTFSHVIEQLFLPKKNQERKTSSTMKLELNQREPAEKPTENPWMISGGWRRCRDPQLKWEDMSTEQQTPVIWHLCEKRSLIKILFDVCIHRVEDMVNTWKNKLLSDEAKTEM